MDGGSEGEAPAGAFAQGHPSAGSGRGRACPDRCGWGGQPPGRLPRTKKSPTTGPLFARSGGAVSTAGAFRSCGAAGPHKIGGLPAGPHGTKRPGPMWGSHRRCFHCGWPGLHGGAPRSGRGQRAPETRNSRIGGRSSVVGAPRLPSLKKRKRGSGGPGKGLRPEAGPCGPGGQDIVG